MTLARADLAESPFNCSVCGQGFARLDVLNKHAINKHGLNVDSAPSSADGGAATVLGKRQRARGPEASTSSDSLGLDHGSTGNVNVTAPRESTSASTIPPNPFLSESLQTLLPSQSEPAMPSLDVLADAADPEASGAGDLSQLLSQSTYDRISPTSSNTMEYSLESTLAWLFGSEGNALDSNQMQGLSAPTDNFGNTFLNHVPSTNIFDNFSMQMPNDPPTFQNDAPATAHASQAVGRIPEHLLPFARPVTPVFEPAVFSVQAPLAHEELGPLVNASKRVRWFWRSTE